MHRPSLLDLCSIRLASAAYLLAVSGITMAADYTRNDLDALAAGGEWTELLEHAKDIAPGERDDSWRSLVSQASVAALRQRESTDVLGAYDLIIALEEEHKSLAMSEPWLDQRANSGLAAVTLCLSDGYYASNCLDALNGLAAGDPENSQLAFESASLMRRYASATLALPLLSAAFEHANEEQQSEFCAHDDTALIVLAGLQNPASAETTSAVGLTFNTCPDNLMPAAFATFLDGDRQIANNTCALWKERDDLSDFQRAHCTDMEATQ